jgi:nucleotide-binding universal stress UspA family protein
MIALKNILVATDFSDPSRVALDYGRDFARAYGATLHVLHVVEDLTSKWSGELGFPLPELQEQWTADAKSKLAAMITDDDRRSMRVVCATTTMTRPALGITDYAKAHAIDLIIAGTHGRGAVQHFLMGSVAELPVRTAPCPVLTVRTHEREFIADDAMVAVETATR